MLMMWAAKQHWLADGDEVISVPVLHCSSSNLLRKKSGRRRVTACSAAALRQRRGSDDSEVVNALHLEHNTHQDSNRI